MKNFPSLAELKYCGYNHNDKARPVARKLLNIPCVITDFNGTQSAKKNSTIDQNNFKKTFSNLSPVEYRNPKITALFKNTS